MDPLPPELSGRPPPPGQPARREPRGVALPLAIGILVALALGVGAGALLFGSDNKRQSATTGGGAADTKPIQLPSTLAGFRDLIQVAATKSPGPSLVKQQRDHQDKLRAATEAAYRKAFGGAAVAYRAYSDDALLKTPYVIAVRAAAPGLTLGPVVDPAYLGFATPDHEVKDFGAVSCQIQWFPPTLQGQTPKPSSEHVANCQRSGSGLTVLVGGNHFDGPADVQLMVAFTNAAWTAVSGS
jgi:hypothetical protein